MPLTAVGVDDVGTRAKCATVTMMLAERIVRHEWSVDEEHLVCTNAMNVWQTLEFLSSVNLRKRYHYEGYNDADNVIRTLTPSWRRDSFAEKPAKGEETASNATFPAEVRREPAGTGTGEVSGGAAAVRASSSKDSRLGSGQDARNYQTSGYYENGNAKQQRSASAQKAHTRKKRGAKNKLEDLELDNDFSMSPLQYTDLVKCT